MRIRTSLVGLAAAAGVLVAAAPAAAQCTTVSTPGVGASFGAQQVCIIPESYGVRAGSHVTHVVRGHNLGNPLSTTNSHFLVECAAESTGAVGTGIKDCFLRGKATGTVYPVGDDDANSGPADANAGEKLSVPMETGGFEVCVRTRAFLRDGSTFYETPLVCATY